ncbi:DUF4169 family protein [Hirschia maritima]|uniref:DUF4169 family protein n=1 Tax=Hirschia maritima TaxID=1121961 RepID=UPI000368605C|nr:DUF4169 family protein [Hirschia maritima]
MVEPINLNKFRKAKAKAEKKQQATENRVLFGATKAEKNLRKAEEDKSRKDIDGKKLED